MRRSDTQAYRTHMNLDLMANEIGAFFAGTTG
jgi:hypothetical protein